MSVIANKIIQTVLKSPVFNEALQYLNKINPPHWFICAGYIQQSYFNYVHGYDLEEYIKDIDVAYFDSLDISENSEIEIQQDLSKKLKGMGILPDVKNQARVHIWYKDKFGHSIEPYKDIFSAIDTFPTTTTTVGIRGKRNNLLIYSAFGFSDFASLTLKPNKIQITKDIYLSKKNKIEKFYPKINIIEW